jgi:hypothetical protein
VASTKIDICNGALIRIGERIISSLADGTETANLCNNRYEIAKRKVFRSHPWKRLRKRAVLAASGTAPAFQWARQFPIPADCLRVWLVVDVNGDPVNEWEFEGNHILSDETIVYLKYIKDYDDVSSLDDSLNEVISLQMAIEMAYQRSADESAVRRLLDEYRLKFAEAKSIDSKEDYQKTITADEWVNAHTKGDNPTRYANLI